MNKTTTRHTATILRGMDLHRPQQNEQNNNKAQKPTADSADDLLWLRLGRIGTLNTDAAASAWWWRRIATIWLFLSLLVVAVVEGTAVSLDGTNYWERKGYKRGEPSWCEASGHAYNRTATLFIRESSNARSDYSYLSVGIGLIVLGATDALADLKYLQQPASMVRLQPRVDPGSNALLAYPVLTICHGCTNVLHGFGTFWFHACQCSEGGRMDVAGMLAVVAWSAIYPVVQLAWQCSGRRPSALTKHVAHMVAALQLLLVVAFHSMRARSDVGMFVLLSLSIFAVVGYAVVYRRVVQLRLRALATTVILFVVGLLAWNADQEKLGATCDPDSWIQGHAAWHVLTCFAIVTLYTYFRTERARTCSDGHNCGDSETCHRVHEPAVAAVVPVHGHEDDEAHK